MVCFDNELSYLKTMAILTDRYAKAGCPMSSQTFLVLKCCITVTLILFGFKMLHYCNSNPVLRFSKFICCDAQLGVKVWEDNLSSRWLDNESTQAKAFQIRNTVKKERKKKEKRS